MTQITAKMVKELREKAGAGMMDCKKALAEAGGDIEAAVDWLRQKGLAAAAKKSGRVAADGLVGLAIDGTRGAVVEVNAETDFVARNEQFQQTVVGVADAALTTDVDVEGLKTESFPTSERTVEEELTHQIATIGENMSLRRIARLSVESGVIASYIHSKQTERLGKIGVIVAMESTGDAAKLEAVGKQIAMHIASTSPASLSRDDLDPEIVEREKKVQVEKAMEEGKPAEIAEKMVTGRMRKFYEEVVLTEQAFVMDTDKTVGQVVADLGKELGTDVKLAGFVRYGLGEGIEKAEDDFAAEVSAMAGV
ncbi:MAG: translation elongation factor Ts [Alphaproteobacteria bacterium]